MAISCNLYTLRFLSKQFLKKVEALLHVWGKYLLEMKTIFIIFYWSSSFTFNHNFSNKNKKNKYWMFTMLSFRFPHKHSSCVKTCIHYSMRSSRWRLFKPPSTFGRWVRRILLSGNIIIGFSVVLC